MLLLKVYAIFRGKALRDNNGTIRTLSKHVRRLERIRPTLELSSVIKGEFMKQNPYLYHPPNQIACLNLQAYRSFRDPLRELAQTQHWQCRRLVLEVIQDCKTGGENLAE